MAKYFIEAAYTPEGIKGLLKDGGSARRDAATRLMEGLGGTVEAFYYSFGSNEAYLIVDMPDNVSMAAAGYAVNASGAVTTKAVALLTPEEVDEACRQSPAYQAPGS
jgi:uncharacterized protein with GYD domain